MEINKLIKLGQVNAINNFSISPYTFDNIIFLQKDYLSMSVENYILERTNCTKERMLSSFKLVNLSSEINSQDVSLLSSSEKLKIELSIALIQNREQINLYQFDKYFMEKDLSFFKKLFKKLVKKYQKTIVLIDCNFSFMLDFVDNLVIQNKKNEVKTFTKDEFYNYKLKSLIEMPDIIDFVKYVNKDKKVLDNITDIKELIKAIYREV